MDFNDGKLQKCDGSLASLNLINRIASSIFWIVITDKIISYFKFIHNEQFAHLRLDLKPMTSENNEKQGISCKESWHSEVLIIK